jgi:hypothetical protein
LRTLNEHRKMPSLGRDLAMEWTSAPQEGQVAHLHAIALRSPILATILDRWADISLPDCWLVAGALVQTVWNDAFHLPPTHGISDVDLVYFDADDLSEEAEARHSTRVRELFSDLPVRSTSRTKRGCIFGTTLSPAMLSSHIPRPQTRLPHFRRPPPQLAFSRG